VAVEGPAFLLAMQLVVCHIQVQHDSLRPPRVIVQERFDEELFNPHTLCGNLLGPLDVPEPFTGLQPIERALAGTSRAHVPRARLSPRGSSLPHSVANDETLVVVIHKAAGERTYQIGRNSEFAKEQPTGIQADHLPIISGDNFLYPRS
jgi:hypothetical protein